MGEATISLQLTPSLEDVRADVSLFAQTKKALKEFLGEDAFFAVERPGGYRRPEFLWK